MPRRTSPKLTVIPVPSVAPPPRSPIKLGQIGQSLWDDIVSSYEFSDRASYETLAQACAAADRAERCREQIDADGECIKVRGGGMRDHPLLKHELTARSFVCRTLARLGLDLEPLRSAAGRPPGR